MVGKTRDSVTTRLAPHHRYRPVDSRAAQGPAARPRPERGLYAGEPEACRRQVLPFLRTMVQLGLLVAIFQKYQIEGRAFLALATLALMALPVHYLIPFRWKKPLFVGTSLVGLFWVFGSEVGSIVVGLAALMIGICYLRVSWTWRVTLLAALAAGLAWARSQSMIVPVPSTVWPVIATMFMFRLIIYLYELKHARGPQSLVDTIGYFFMLPNYCFMHFPVVDYQTLQRGYFADDVHAIQRRGLQMMFRGTLHLICYRLIYHNALIPAADVHDAWSLAGYLVCNYLLYLRVSGQFHMACGMLHLFGYKLPDTHHWYLLASGFTDYWRRINIYWKDFMVRLVFNPVVFRLKRWPQPAALAVGTVTVFLATWSLHAYQSFWLRGTWGLSTPDTLFWGVLGVLVMVNVQLDARRSRNRGGARIKQAPAGPASWRNAAGPLALRGLRTGATFVTIAMLWSLWSSPSLTAWLNLLRRGIQGI